MVSKKWIIINLILLYQVKYNVDTLNGNDFYKGTNKYCFYGYPSARLCHIEKNMIRLFITYYIYNYNIIFSISK